MVLGGHAQLSLYRRVSSSNHKMFKKCMYDRLEIQGHCFLQEPHISSQGYQGVSEEMIIRRADVLNQGKARNLVLGETRNHPTQW